MSAILRCPEVIKKTGDARSTLYLKIADGLFPRPVAIGRRSVGWPETEVDAINAARIAGKSEDEIKKLVARLVAARGTA